MSVWKATYKDTESLSYMFDNFHKYDGIFSETVLCEPSTHIHHRLFIFMHRIGMR